MENEYKILIREHHLDSYGHVNNATYLSLYEEARWDIVTKKGFGYDRVHQTKMGPIILEINLKFLKELKLREEITITMELLSYQGKIGQLRQRMIQENGDVASEATFTFGLFDMAARKLILPTEEWKRAVGIS